MKERPVLFSGTMVNALLRKQGPKTKTRRIIKPQPPIIAGADSFLDRCKKYGWTASCPYGQVGDRLWVRETWHLATGFGDDTGVAVRYAADDAIVDRRAPAGTVAKYGQDLSIGDRARPSIHMPRWVSRITLEITGIDLERLQDISRGDAMSEGCPFSNMAAGPDPRQWYAELWESLNGIGSWAANPWVWVIGFRKVA